MKFKIKEAYLLILIVLGLVSLSIYSTYALFTKEVSINNVVSFNSTISLSDSNLVEYELITLNPNEIKKVELRISNTSTSNLYYGCWYELLTNNADILIGQDKDTLVNNVITTTGVINTSDTTTIIIGITNNTNSKVLLNIGVIGSTSSSLGLAEERHIITETWQNVIIVDNKYLEDHTTITTGTVTNEYTEPKMTEVTLNPGTYTLEAWGAQGGSYSTTYTGGKGGYSKGTLTLNEETKVYIYVGGQGGAHSTTTGGTSAGGFNGGGSAKTVAYSGTTSYVTGGGGASDIRLGTDSLYARVIVAGGGSGSSNANSGYYGGGTSAGYGQSGYGATQTSAGTNGSFGQGANAVPSSTNYKYASPGGGGGWYGGGSSGTNRSDSTDYRKYTGGGSGYVYTSSTASNYPSGCLLNANYYLTDAATYAGNTSFTDSNGVTATGHSGNGVVKISGTGTISVYSIPTITGLSNMNIFKGDSKSLEENVTYKCEFNGDTCTYLGPDITDTSTLEEGTHTIYYSIKTKNNSVYKYARTISVKILTAADKIINLATSSSCDAGGTGLCATNSYTDENGETKYHDYRYRGAEPNNFVIFNDDLYRIIGVFDSNSHGREGEYLIKLIMEDPLYAGSWGVYNTTNTSGTYSNYKSDWSGNTTGVKASANVILNEYFYNKTNTSITYGACSDWTYYSNNNNYKTLACSDIVGYGIKSKYRNYIEEVTWYLKGYSGNGYSKQNFYLCERGLSTDTTNCMSGNQGAYAATTTARIGLMYVSDYLYASSYYRDSDSTTASAYYYGNKNWLFKGFEWTIVPNQRDGSGSFTIKKDSGLYPNMSFMGWDIRPTFYLKLSISIAGGTGTINDPYIIN